MTIKIAHECPLSMMKDIDNLTDYDYYISTICKQVPEYFLHATKSSRYKILDCGVFEEGIPMEELEYISYIKAIQPDEYIIPDFIGDSKQTVENVKRWKSEICPTLKGLPIGVVQGSTFSDQVMCYMQLTALCCKIAFPYALSGMSNDNIGFNITESIINGNGRYNLINYLIRQELFDKSIKHHLLGIDLPAEIIYYRNKGILSLFDSIDTSSPILHGIKGVEYDSKYGILKKNRDMMKDYINLFYIDEEKKYLVIKNINIFKSFCT